MSTETIERTDTLEATEWGDASGKGLVAAMDEFFDGAKPSDSLESNPNLAETKADETAAEITETTEFTETTPKKEELEPVIDEEFFPEETTEKEVEKARDDKAFDESAFEKETEELSKGMDEKAGNRFKELRTELKELKQRQISPDVEAKLQALELKAQEAEGLRVRLEELSSQSARMKVESSDSYEAEVLKPAAKIFKQSDELAEMYEVDKSILRTIIKETDRRVQNDLVNEHLEKLSDFDRSEMYRMIQDFKRVVSKREDMLANADKEIAKQETARIESEKALLEEQRRTVQTLQKDIWSKYKEVIPGFIEDGDETPEFKKLMSKGLSIDFGAARAQDQAYASFAGVVLPHLVKQVNALRKQLSEFEGANKRQQTSSPTPSGSIAPSSPDGNKNESFVEKFVNMDFSG